MYVGKKTVIKANGEIDKKGIIGINYFTSSKIVKNIFNKYNIAEWLIEILYVQFDTIVYDDAAKNLSEVEAEMILVHNTWYKYNILGLNQYCNDKFYLIHTDATRRNQGQKTKKFYIDHPEARIKLSETRKKFFKEHPEILASIRQNIILYWFNNPIARLRRASNLRKYWRDTPNASIKLSTSLKEYYRITPDARQIRSNSLKRYYVDHPEVCAQLRENMFKRYIETPELRLQISNSLYDFYTSNPTASSMQTAKRLQYYKDNPEAALRKLKTQKAYYINNVEAASIYYKKTIAYIKNADNTETIVAEFESKKLARETTKIKGITKACSMSTLCRGNYNIKTKSIVSGYIAKVDINDHVPLYWRYAIADTDSDDSSVVQSKNCVIAYIKNSAEDEVYIKTFNSAVEANDITAIRHIRGACRKKISSGFYNIATKTIIARIEKADLNEYVPLFWRYNKKAT